MRRWFRGRGQSRDAQYKPVNFTKNSPAEPSSHHPVPSDQNVKSSGYTRVTADKVNGEPRHHEAPASLSSTTGIRLSHSATPSPKVTTRISTKPAVWSPGQIRMESKKMSKPTSIKSQDTEERIPTVWSPTNESVPKREYRPVKIESFSTKVGKSNSPTPNVKEDMYDFYYRRPNVQPAALQNDQKSVKPEDSSTWKPPDPMTSSLSTGPPTTPNTSLTTGGTTSPTTVLSSSPSHSNWNGTISNFAETKSGLPQSQSPTITLLQKSREGQFAKGAIYVGSKETVEGDVKHTDTYYLIPTEESVTRKTTEKKAPSYIGIGPEDKTGIPVGLRKHVDDANKKEWYKKMFKSLNESGKPDKEKKNTYRPTYTFPEPETESEREEPNPYKPSYEQPSKKVNGKEDSWKTLSLDRNAFSPTSNGSPTKDRSSWSPPHAKYRPDVYRNQPRSITDYEPGFSSIAFREARTDEEGGEESQLYNPPIEKPGQFSQYTYKDDSKKIVKHNRPLSPSSDLDAHETYKQVHKGGEIPIGGLRVPYPKKKKVPTATLR